MSYLKKRNLTQHLITLAAYSNVALATSFIINTAPAKSQNVPASSYQSSCTNIRITGSGDRISARCLRRNLTYNNTSIYFRGIHNINGVLQFQGLDSASSFQLSCTNIFIAGNTLVASCRRINGSYNTTSILIPGIHNIDGILTY